MKHIVKLALLVAVCACLVLSGCDQVTSLLGSSTASSTPYASTLDDGREVEGYVDGRMGDTLTNVFFSYSVNSAYLANEYEGQTAPEGTTYLVAEITVKNVYGEEIPMWAEDFQVQWGGEGDDDYGYPIDKFTDEQMEYEFAMKKGETVTAVVVYEVPTPTEKTEYSISYLEYYEDDVEGNVFFVYFELDPPANV